MNERTKSQYVGISFTGVLAVLFIGLKLTGYIKWPWLWVLSSLSAFSTRQAEKLFLELKVHYTREFQSIIKNLTD